METKRKAPKLPEKAEEQQSKPTVIKEAMKRKPGEKKPRLKQEESTPSKERESTRAPKVPEYIEEATAMEEATAFENRLAESLKPGEMEKYHEIQREIQQIRSEKRDKKKADSARRRIAEVQAAESALEIGEFDYPEFPPEELEPEPVNKFELSDERILEKGQSELMQIKMSLESLREELNSVAAVWESNFSDSSEDVESIMSIVFEGDDSPDEMMQKVDALIDMTKEMQIGSMEDLVKSENQWEEVVDLFGEVQTEMLDTQSAWAAVLDQPLERELQSIEKELNGLKKDIESAKKRIATMQPVF